MGSIAAAAAPLYKKIDVDATIAQLRIDEKISLLSGRDPWHTASVHRLGIPSIRCTDGPNGVRGTRFFNGVPAACLPCGTALAATWNPKLIKKGGILQGHEAIAKGASIILGPTTNIQRSPLGGRGFESFSEDPVLAGSISAATIDGIQSTGVAATLKHFVCNDQEHERQSMDVRISERALREIYLMPFQIAERDAQPMAYMTSYNRVNGIHVSEDKRLIQDVLRSEWGFDGMVMSDWFGVYSTTESILAGLDLEMPGPSYIRGSQVRHALGCGKLQESDIDCRVREVLKLVNKVLPLAIEENAPELTIDTPETAATLRAIASDGIVLLKNEANVLPFTRDKTIAVIGPNADFAAYCGGGSASLVPYYAISPLEGVKAQMKGRQPVQYELGAPGWKKLPLLSRLTTATDGMPGLTMTTYLQPPSLHPKRSIVESLHINTSDIFLADYHHPSIKTNLFYLELDGTFTPEETAEYEFSLSVSGTGKVYVDGACVVDNETRQTPGDSFFGSGTVEEIGCITLEKNQQYNIHVTFGSLPTSTYTVAGATAFGSGGLRVGCTRKIHLPSEIERAVKLAQSVDQVLLCCGLNGDWESEGYDRSTMDLPPGSDDLIRAVVKANPNTAIVLQSGTPVTMPWLQDAPAILQAWYGGNECGNSIADVVFGDTNPSGKLPLSFPLRNEDNPAFHNYRTEAGRTVYGEGIFVGYRHYEKTQREVAFPFGHGLSYTTFELSSLALSIAGSGCETEVVLKVAVTNTGPRDGAYVVQAYVSRQGSSSVSRPVKELKGFAKVLLRAGERAEGVEIRIPRKYATSFYDERRAAWCEERGTYAVLVGDSSASVPLSASFEVEETRWWTGL